MRQTAWFKVLMIIIFFQSEYVYVLLFTSLMFIYDCLLYLIPVTCFLAQSMYHI